MSGKHLLRFLLGILFTGTSILQAQDYSYHAYKNNKERYAQPLSTLLEWAAADLGITIVVADNVKPYQEKTVPMAPWKYWNNPELRLAYILAPLDLSFEKTVEKSYQVFDLWYQNQSEKEQNTKSLMVQLQNTREDLGITIDVADNVKPYQDLTVSTAPWNYGDNPELRLAFILAPLDLTFEKIGEKHYRVYEPWYQNRPEEEGEAHLDRLWDRFPDKESWEGRRAEVKKAILDTFGLIPMPKKTPLNPISTEERVLDGYSVRHVALEIIPHYWLCGSLYRPAEGEGPFPLVACPHGHGENGRLADDHQYRCATLARMGAIVFAYSMFAWIPEESPLKKPDDHRNPISGAMQTLGSIRVIDYLTSLEGADTTRIGITGASGGGTQTFIAAAVDDRITVSVPVVMVSAYMFGGCPCESGTPLHTKAGGICTPEIAAAAAPKAQKLIAITTDWTHNTPQVEYPYIRHIYGYYDAQDKIEYAYIDEQHDYGPSKRAAMYPFMAKHLGLDMSKVDESKVTILPREEMLPFGPNREKYPADAVQTIDDVIKAFNECPREGE